MLWALWGALHSLLIWPPFSAKIANLLGRRAGWQRLLYNLFATATLVPIAALHIFWRSNFIVKWSGPWLAIPIAMDVLGIWLLYLGFRSYKANDFMGFAAARAALRGEPAAASSLSFDGVLKHIRHPYYAATILLLWGHGMDSGDLAASIVLTMYVFVGTWLEERKLTAQFGEAYLEYKRDAPAFVPWKLFGRGR